MLTEAEKKWLERRKNLCARCEFNLYDNPCIKYGKRGASGEYPGFYSTLCAEYNFEDAAEFEARVAEKLARNICYNCPDNPDGCPASFEAPRRTGESCRMKHARLAAEAEMDNTAGSK